MREVLSALREWYQQGIPYGLATVVGVRGGRPREPGSVLAVNPAGEAVGGVSGGCVDAEVYECAMTVLDDGVARLRTYGTADDDPFAVGPTCGGTIEVLVRRVPAGAVDGAALAALAEGRPIATATVLGGPAPLGAQLLVWSDRTAGTLGDGSLDAQTTADTRALLARGVGSTLRYANRDRVTLFVQAFAAPPRLLIFGATDVGAALSRFGAGLGYRVTVCDARPIFATRRRFPYADEVCCEWPHQYLERTEVDQRTAICVLTHDPKFDIPLLVAALRTDAGYLGVLGSRGTHADRLGQLRAEGITGRQLARLSAPIGLDLGARTPAETAVAIVAEIIASRAGGTGSPLRQLTGPIHHPRRPVADR